MICLETAGRGYQHLVQIIALYNLQALAFRNAAAGGSSNSPLGAPAVTNRIDAICNNNNVQAFELMFPRTPTHTSHP